MRRAQRRNFKPLALALGTSFGLFVLVLFLLSGTSKNRSSQNLRMRKPSDTNTRKVGFAIHRKPKHRLAIIVPFMGEKVESIPTYLNVFCTAAAGSASLVDFLLIHNGVLDAYSNAVPSNVKLISLGSTDALIERFMRVLDERPKEELKFPSLDHLAKTLSKHIHHYPYVLVEFKPALGHIFDDHLAEYSHWGYSDLDIVFGDLPRWITPDELNDYDIVTYSYGDQDRVYLRGQFTFHKNTQKVKQLWRDCEYLSKMDVRFADVLSGKKKLRVESAEGCYSSAILKRKDISVKYAVKAFNDINRDDTAATHGLYFAIGSKRDKSILYKTESAENGKSLLDLPPMWFEAKDNIYGSKQQRPLQRQVGSREVVEMNGGRTDCMYWASPKYQSRLCVDGVNRMDTLFWINGTLYKQSYENEKLPGNVISSPFFHFQEWKRYYRTSQLTSVQRTTEAIGWIMTKEGAIPLLPPHNRGRRWASLIAPLGRNLAQWRSAGAVDRKQLPHHHYCLRSGPRKIPPRPPAPQCEHSVSWQETALVEILHGAPVWKFLDVEHEVTLALTLQITAKQAVNHQALDGVLDVVAANVRAWQGQPCVLVIHMAGATEEGIERVHNRLGLLDLEACLVAMINHTGPNLVSRKALMNMAIDAAPTRWVLSGVEIERGMVLSTETSMFAHRRAKIHAESAGNIFIVPQFSVGSDEDRNFEFSTNDLLDIKEKGEPAIQHPDDFDSGDCEDPKQSTNTIFDPTYDMWWRLSLAELNGKAPFESSNDLLELAIAYDDIQLSFEGLLTSREHFEMFALDVSPILMIDSAGPRRGMTTSELVLEVEEFGGKLCYNGMRLAQLATLGYHINMLSGAFAMSTRGSRRSASGVVKEDELGSSRCDGCFMFYDDHEDILEAIVHDERQRPAKAALVWDELH